MVLRKLKRILDETRQGRLPLHLKRKFGDRQTAFEALYRLRYWNMVGPRESASGPGSAVETTVTIREALAHLVRELNVKSVFDAACGDFNWMKEVDLGGASYQGVDIVPEIVAAAQKKYGGPLRRFQHLDIVEGPIPKVDLIFCRDVLIHLPDKDVLKVLRNFSTSGSSYLLTPTSPMLRANRNIARAADWRPINMCIPPFSLPEPIAHFPDLVCDDVERATVLGLWELPLKRGRSVV